MPSPTVTAPAANLTSGQFVNVEAFRTYVQPLCEAAGVTFDAVSCDGIIKEARCTYVLTPLQKPSQSVCAFGLPSWGFIVKAAYRQDADGRTEWRSDIRIAYQLG